MKLKHTSHNLHQLTITREDLDIIFWFSYETPIAYKVGNDKVVMRDNDWGIGTHKHLKYIQNNYEYIQLDGKGFERLLSRFNY